jgi:hypothetical protein
LEKAIYLATDHANKVKSSEKKPNFTVFQAFDRVEALFFIFQNVIR